MLRGTASCLRSPYLKKGEGTARGGIGWQDEVPPKGPNDLADPKEARPDQSKHSSFSKPAPGNSSRHNGEKDSFWQGRMMGMRLLSKPGECEVPSSSKKSPNARSGARIPLMVSLYQPTPERNSIWATRVMATRSACS